MPGPEDEPRDDHGMWTTGGGFKQPPPVKVVPKHHVIITAENPGGRQLDPHQNELLQARMADELRQRGFLARTETSQYTDSSTGETLQEHPFVVEGMTPAQAEEMAARYGQNSVVTEKGLHDLKEGKLYPSTGVEQVDPSKADTYTTYRNGAFSHKLDFEHPQELHTKEEDRKFAEAITQHIREHPEMNKPDPAAQAYAEEELRDYPTGA